MAVPSRLVSDFSCSGLQERIQKSYSDRAAATSLHLPQRCPPRPGTFHLCPQAVHGRSGGPAVRRGAQADHPAQ
eukprot:1138164-Pelagomonas_calceolata.AAC.7